MSYINWPSVQDLLANPNKYGSFFTRIGPDGYSIYSRMKEFPSEAAINYENIKQQYNTQFERIVNDVYNAVNSGASQTPNSSQMQDLKAKVASMQGVLSGLPDLMKGDQLQSVEQMVSGNIKDPQGTQVVKAGGEIVTPSDFGTKPSTTPTPTQTPQGGAPVASGGASESAATPASTVSGQVYADLAQAPNGNIAGAYRWDSAKNGWVATGITPSSQIDSADKSWVNDLYQKFFDRTATAAELANWSKESPVALEQFLGAEAKKYGYTSKAMQETSQGKLTQAQDIIKNSNLPDDIKNLFNQVVASYPPGVEYDTEEIINTFNNIKSTTIDPYFKELSNIAINDIKTAQSQISQDREMELEAQRTAAGQNIRQTKENLAKSGMTFTGKAVETLGAQAATPQAQGVEGLPAQQPFGGMFYEGTVNQANRLQATSTQARYQKTLDSLASEAEKTLGSGETAKLGITTPVGGITGTMETQKQQQYGTTLNQIIENYRNKTQSMTNI